MKILHVIPGIAWQYGGTTATIRSLCAELSGLPGIEIELATTDADGPNGRLKRSDVPHGYPVHVFPRTATEQWKYSRDLGRWLRQNTQRFDVVHIHALWSYATHAAARAAERADVPYIIRPAGMLSNYSFARRAWKKRMYWRWAEHRTVRKAAAFHATSSAEREDILRVRCDATVHVIPNGVDQDAWKLESTPLTDCRRFRDSCDGQRIVLFLSRLHPKKGIVDLLLPAWAQVRTDALLVIAGGADSHAPKYAELVRHEIGRLQLTSRVRLLGAIPSDRRWELYDAAELFVLPSHSENFGVVVAEAMSRGCPVIITDQVQASEHVVAANAGNVVPANVPSLVAALTTMLADPEGSQACGRRGHDYARDHFTWQQIATVVRCMYDQTLLSVHQCAP